MQKTNKKPRKEIAPERREQLVQATCAIIDKVGLKDATLGQIAGQIGISAGLVTHYFGDKQNLLYATMRKIMNDLKNGIKELQRHKNTNDPAARIRMIIDGNFHTSQNHQALIRTWLNFWVASLYDDDLQRLQKINRYILFSTLYSQLRKLAPKEAARDGACGLACLIDGLWLHLALSTRATGFSFEDSRRLAHQYLDCFLARYALAFS